MFKSWACCMIKFNYLEDLIYAVLIKTVLNATLILTYDLFIYEWVWVIQMTCLKYRGECVCTRDQQWSSSQ